MTVSASIFHSPAAQPAAQSGATADAASSASSGGTSTIGANDFLTLLVTEMQNQDPTNAADPNEYVNQLVSVNSLEQLIEINQTLSGALFSGGSSPSPKLIASPPVDAAQPGHASPAISFGNLATPQTTPAAEQVARAFAPHPRA